MASEKEDIRISEIDELIRLGKGDEAVRKLRELARSKVPRENALRVANLARRANLPLLAIRLLYPIVRPSSKVPVVPTDKEKAEYAGNLLRIGAAIEANRILKGINTSKAPEALLFGAFACFSQWDYASAIPLLSGYIVSPLLDDYQKLVGKVNLSAALVFEREHDRAGTLLEEILKQTGDGHFPLLYGNALELSAQNMLLQGKLDEAESYLTRSERELARSGGLDAFFVRKWKSIIRMLRKPARAKDANLDSTREEARSRSHWETIRDCDFFEAVHNEDKELLTHLYFGTPFASFRTRVLRHLGGTGVFRIRICGNWIDVENRSASSI